MGDSFYLDYRLGELLGRVQFGAIYQCVSVSTGELFAVKIIDKFSGCFDRQVVYSEIKFTLLAAFQDRRFVQIHQDDQTSYEASFCFTCFTKRRYSQGGLALVEGTVAANAVKEIWPRAEIEDEINGGDVFIDLVDLDGPLVVDFSLF